jgi:HlyD family secretion protein
MDVKVVLVGVATAAAALAATIEFGPLSLLHRSPANPTLVVSGNIEAHESVLSFQAVQSRIVDLPFDEGQWVDAETVLARLDDSDYSQQVSVDSSALRVQKRQLAAARQSLEAATKTVQSDAADMEQKTLDFNRLQKLWQEHVESTQNRDRAETLLKQSRAVYLRDQAMVRVAEKNVAVAQANVHYAREKLQLSKILLSYTVLRAPFAGVILVRQAEVGEVMLPGTAVLTLADLDHVWLRAYVNETDLAKIHWGQTASVHTDTYPDKRYQGRISFIASKAEFTPKSVETHAERVTLVYRIKIDVENPNYELKPGMPADATIDLSSTDANG